MSSEVRTEVDQPSITRTFPVGAPKGLDPSTFKDALRDATREYVRILASLEIGTYGQEVFRLKDGGFFSVGIRFPRYASWDWEKVKGHLEAPGLRKLLNYLWDQGEIRISLMGPDPQRESWEAFALAKVVHPPVARALIEAAIDEAIDTGAVTYCKVPDASLETELKEQTLRWCHGVHRYLARCPLGYVKMEPEASWSLGNGIKLRRFSEREVVGHLTRYSSSVFWRDLLSLEHIDGLAVLEVLATYDPSLGRSTHPKPLQEIVKEDIADKVDLAKWSLMTALRQEVPLIEGTITYDLLGHDVPVPFSGRSFRRQDVTGGVGYERDENLIDRARCLVAKAMSLRPRSKYLDQAFFYWGRSALGELDRDRLLEAVIGLERLLVPGPGESTYRFGLHGAALLTRFGDSPEACNEDLRSIYRKRSELAHGNPGERLIEAQRARRHLGDAILAIMDLIEAGKIQESENVATQIQALVLKGSPI